MAGSLGADAVARYQRDGFLFPLRVMPAGRAAGYRARFEAFDGGEQARAYDDVHNQIYLLKPYLLFAWVNELVRTEALLDAAESLVGPDILCWSAGLFTKMPHSRAFVSWHQDATNFELDDVAGVVRAWLALTPCSPANGTMRFLPGVHRGGARRHADTAQQDGLLSRGETIDLAIDEAATVPVCLDAGEVSFHHLHTPHASGANDSPMPRINLVITYMTPARRPLSDEDSAMLVRGRDRYGHFLPEPPPAADFDGAAIATHAEAMARRNAIIYRGATPPAPARHRLAGQAGMT